MVHHSLRSCSESYPCRLHSLKKRRTTKTTTTMMMMGRARSSFVVVFLLLAFHAMKIMFLLPPQFLEDHHHSTHHSKPCPCASLPVHVYHVSSSLSHACHPHPHSVHVAATAPAAHDTSRHTLFADFLFPPSFFPLSYTLTLHTLPHTPYICMHTLVPFSTYTHTLAVVLTTHVRIKSPPPHSAARLGLRWLGETLRRRILLSAFEKKREGRRERTARQRERETDIISRVCVCVTLRSGGVARSVR